jgi:hypothetical protein
MAIEQVFRKRCIQDDCTGIRLPTTAWCLAHAVEQAPDAFEAELERISAEGTVDARGVVISAELLARVLDATPRRHNRPTFMAAWFGEATLQGDAGFYEANFQGEANFGEASFQGKAGFGGASFEGRALFSGVRFQDGAEFRDVSFQGEAGFNRASFQGRAGFIRANFQGRATFDGTTFKDTAWFDGTTFKGDAQFDRATFERNVGFARTTFEGDAAFYGTNLEGRAEFGDAIFKGDAWFIRTNFLDHAGFSRANFQRDARFGETRFKGDAWFRGASFERATHIGPLLTRELILDGAVFGARVQLDVTAAAVCARRAQFPAGVHLRLRYATVVLDDASLAASAILAGVPSPFPDIEEHEHPVSRAWERLPPGPRAQRWRPRLLSIRRADVAGLRLADVDLRACRFAGAHNLDRLGIEGRHSFSESPSHWHWAWTWPPLWKWTGRWLLAEEHQWRADRERGIRRRGWFPNECRHPGEAATPDEGVEQEPRERAREISQLYRELRKGQEDRKDEPGAADFYYGEMEMRRQATARRSFERAMLGLYWLVSGYGLRASRALGALLLVVLVAALVFAGPGFQHPDGPRCVVVDATSAGMPVYRCDHDRPPSYRAQLPTAMAYSAESATSLLRGPDQALTPVGHWTQVALRLLGPVLFGLVVLSIRGRVRR